MTLMEFAVSQVFDSSAGSAPLDIVCALLARGADPNAGLEPLRNCPTASFSRCCSTGAPSPGSRRPRASRVPAAEHDAAREFHDPARSRHGCQPQPRLGSAPHHRRGGKRPLEFRVAPHGSRADVTRDGRSRARLDELVQSPFESTSDRPEEMKADIARVKARLPALTTRCCRHASCARGYCRRRAGDQVLRSSIRRAVLVTGASSGIGRKVTERLAQRLLHLRRARAQKDPTGSTRSRTCKR